MDYPIYIVSIGLGESIGMKRVLHLIMADNVKMIILHIGQVKNKFERNIALILLSISLNMCFGCSKELSYLDGSFEHPQHLFWLRNKKNNFQLHTLI